MKFKEIINRLTGFNVPIFGVSWKPPKAQITIARDVITYLEDRRVLFNPYHMEDSRNCVHSVLDIREYLTARLSESSGEELIQHLRAMRAACRKFLDVTHGGDFRFRGMRDEWEFNSALGELRGIMGIHVAAIAAQYGLDVEDDLASILPVTDNEGGESGD